MGPDLTPLLLSAIGGAVLGAVFFGGLWFTVQRGLRSPQPALWFVSSFLLRTIITVAGLWALADGRWQRLVAALIGFVVARAFVHASTAPPSASEAAHAPQP